ncbi:hypothetical protein F4775DRAFT_263620 [Biscogniauxia sp. FL1348]|nr:hypothetical protein F4775DRAFT_263620 [Biscogniauxia sp. FL1348]
MMFSSYESIYPLTKVSRNDLSKLCEALWNWEPCADWTADRICQHSPSLGCCYQKAERLRPFFEFYRDVTAYYVPELDSDCSPAIQSHDNLIDIIRCIKSHADKPRLQITVEYFSARSKPGYQQLTPSNDQNRAFSLASRVITMLLCSVEGQTDGLLEAGSQPSIWHSDRSFNQFIDTAIPRHGQVRLGPYHNLAPQADLPLGSITAKRLRKVAKLTLIPTNDIRDHLLLDKTKGTVAVYHYTSVLKEHLEAASRSSTKQEANLPNALVLETLYTLKHVLFPIDPESQSVLRFLVAKEKFDPDICRVDVSWQLPERESLAYEHWGGRLLDLYDELENPAPRGFLETWMERRSGARHVMMATIFGVLIAILLGILGLAVSLAQLWITWQQWRHPVT